ncbi:hypothetical protein LPJ61_001816 [Coemansia biformis]|uniref:Phosphatase activator n=1 Tax=Coemansia biformis TaxID=1286918 RepID=A0A9W7YFZ2_9FUNG|nr:hypothetical protein LPJ61_001816 [Coemansia biformis]
MGESIITSVTQQTAFARPHGDSGGDFLPAQLPLNVRGRRFVLDRETLNHLPDSLLNTMFPNGLLQLGRGYDTYGYETGDYYRAGSGEAEQTWVDFDPDMLAYVLQAYGRALDADLLAEAGVAQGGGDGSSGGGGGGQSDTPDDSPVWLNYNSDGKANIAGSAGSNGAGARGATGSAAPKGETNNDSLSTFTDTGSHVNNNSSSGATQSTSSSAVLNYMRFVSGAGAHGGARAGGAYRAPPASSVTYHDSHPLVVLREELDYFVVPLSGRTRGDISVVPEFTLDMAKTRCGELLIEDDSVFEPLERTMQRNLEKWRTKVNAEGVSDEAQALQSASIIEQQLIDMLCLAGFPRDARWGCRRVEPSKTSVTSLLTVPLDESADQSRMVAAQKLLLFYKKPARKCWWEGEDVNAGNSEHKIDLKLWCRRTWTLELVLV